jgi:hypothetical protein
MTVPNDLARLLARIGEAQSIDDIVEAHLKDLQQILTGHPATPLGLDEVATELPFEDAVHLADLLLLAQLQTVFRWSS